MLEETTANMERDEQSPASDSGSPGGASSDNSGADETEGNEQQHSEHNQSTDYGSAEENTAMSSATAVLSPAKLCYDNQQNHQVNANGYSNVNFGDRLGGSTSHFEEYGSKCTYDNENNVRDIDSIHRSLMYEREHSDKTEHRDDIAMEEDSMPLTESSLGRSMEASKESPVFPENTGDVDSQQYSSPEYDDPKNPLAKKTSAAKPAKSRIHRCKQCEFSTIDKDLFWDHSRTHMRDDKILSCPKCKFVTEYKHHLEYHLRNHFGSKPFKCTQCNYSCVNKSMLNSHMKSHSNFYQYRCRDCSYATKYCHSLKLHLRKYNHKPATMVSGTELMMYQDPESLLGKRGPREIKKKLFGAPNSHAPILGEQMSASFPFGFPLPLTESSKPNFLPPSSQAEDTLKEARDSEDVHLPLLMCNMCDFSSQNREHLGMHMMKHAAEHQDLLKLYGLHIDNLPEDVYSPSMVQGTSDKSSPATKVVGLIEEKPNTSFLDARLNPLARMMQMTENADALDLSINKTSKKTDSDVDTTRTDEGASVAVPQDGKKPSSSSRRKGKAFKLDKISMQLQGKSSSHPGFHRSFSDIGLYKGDTQFGQPEPNWVPSQRKWALPERESETSIKKVNGNHPHNLVIAKSDDKVNSSHKYECTFCEMAFADCVMYTVHMGYHDYRDPFKCNMCGCKTDDKMSFFLHIARAAHS